MSSSDDTHKKSSSPHKKGKSPKRGKDVKPLHEEELKKQLKADKEQAQANADMLADLAKKTQELAEKVKGPDVSRTRVLNLESGETEVKDIFDELDDINEKTKESNSNSKTTAKSDSNPAADVIRGKLNRLFNKEPDATTEAAESIAVVKRSKHQEFMYNLTTSGKSLADIQTQWHEYYVALPDNEKHEVWQEFYKNQHNVSSWARHQENVSAARKETPEPQADSKKRNDIKSMPLSENRTINDVKNQIMHKVSAGGQLKPIHQVKSLLFGLGLAAFSFLLITFVFFNEAFVAPFISPSSTVSATPIIGNNPGDIGPEPKIIIPKINLEVPVVYDLNSVKEKDIQNALEDGVVHYSASPEPGQIGNSVIVGHSSNNILNSGKYKFAFVLLKRLEIEDTFFIHKDGIRYTYKVFEKKIVPPTDVSVLGESSRTNTMTLITCDPPGTSINRLILVAEQISPDSSGNTESNIQLQAPEEELPSNAPSLWSRLIGIF